LVRKPRAPARKAATTESSSEYAVSTTTRIRGCLSTILRVASTPSQFGMCRSMRTMSGTAVIAWRTASAPSIAVPITSIPGSMPSSVARPSRTTFSSSATSTRSGAVVSFMMSALAQAR
jgi:hypothetical protein